MPENGAELVESRESLVVRGFENKLGGHFGANEDTQVSVGVGELYLGPWRE